MAETADQMPIFEATISILGYKEDGEWVALALEMDIRGYGKTFEEALDDLRDLVFMQIGFALSKNCEDMIWKDAEQRYFEMYAQTHRDELRKALRDPGRNHPEYQTAGLRIPPAHVIAGLRGGFSGANA